MNYPIKEQLARYTEEFDALLTPLDPETVFQPPELEINGVLVVAHRRRLPVWAVAVLTGLLVVVLVGVLPWLLSNPDQPGVVDTTPTTVAPNVDGQVFEEWTMVEAPFLAAGLTRFDAMVLSSRENEFVFCTRGAFATSSNGLDWELQGGGAAFGDSCTTWGSVAVDVEGGGASQAEGGPYVTDPSFVIVNDPDQSSSRFRVDGDVLSVAIGGQGILVLASDSRFDPSVIFYNETGRFMVDLETFDVVGGFLIATFADGSTESIDLADAGIDPDDVGKTEWWFSADGTEWMIQPTDIDLPSVEMVGSTDGFYAVGGSRAWFTRDGQVWEDLGEVGERGRLQAVVGRPAFVGEEGFVYLDERPMVTITFGALPEGQAFPFLIGRESAIAVGKELDGATSLWYSEQGQPFEPQELPLEMLAVKSEYGPYGGVVGNRYILLIFDAERNPTFWIKDFAPAK